MTRLMLKCLLLARFTVTAYRPPLAVWDKSQMKKDIFYYVSSILKKDIFYSVVSGNYIFFFRVLGDSKSMCETTVEETINIDEIEYYSSDNVRSR